MKVWCEKCRNGIIAKLEENYGKVEFSNEFETLALNDDGLSMNLPPLEFSYHPKKTDGTPSKRTEYGRLLYTYCPFCCNKLFTTDTTVVISEKDSKKYLPKNQQIVLNEILQQLQENKEKAEVENA